MQMCQVMWNCADDGAECAGSNSSRLSRGKIVRYKCRGEFRASGQKAEAQQGHEQKQGLDGQTLS